MKKELNIDILAKKSTKNEAPAPDPIIWLKLEKKLDRRRYGKNLTRHQYLSIAAVFVCLLACVILMSIFIQSNRPVTGVASDYILEDLSDSISDPEGFYATVSQLNDIYAKAGLSIFEEDISE